MFLVVTCKLNFLSGKLFCVCCVYAPNHNPAQDQFLKDFHPKIDCGDFNEVFDCSLFPCLTAPPRPSICSRTAASLTYGG